MQRPRQLITLLGTPEETRMWAENLVAALKDVARVSGKAHDLLGQSFDAVILDAHGRLDADVLARCEGLVWEGGALIVRLDEQPTGRFVRRCHRHRRQFPPPEALPPLEHRPRGTRGQADVVAQLRELLGGPPCLIVLTAPRGRGKSAALGMALQNHPEAAATALHPRSLGEVLRFSHQQLCYTPLDRLAEGNPRLIVVDEAAQLGLAKLKRLVEEFAGATLVFSTTVAGYEGSGRGFQLRFVDWLGKDHRPLHQLRLEEPIRWGPDDPLESFVTNLLLLHADPGPPPAYGPHHHRVLERDHLAENERLLEEVFALLVQAHYCTTPGDLERLLDAPNITIHGLFMQERPVAVCLAEEEGPLDPTLARALEPEPRDQRRRP